MLVPTHVKSPSIHQNIRLGWKYLAVTNTLAYSDTNRCSHFHNKLSGQAKANGREPKSCLGQVFRFKLVRFAVVKEVRNVNMHQCLKLKT